MMQLIIAFLKRPAGFSATNLIPKATDKNSSSCKVNERTKERVENNFSLFFPTSS